GHRLASRLPSRAPYPPPVNHRAMPRFDPRERPSTPLAAPYHGRVTVSAGVVLAGGRSSRMGTPKAALEWHGSTLLYRTVAIVGRATGGPVVVVRASGQDLPDLPKGTRVIDDPREGKGPVQGIATGLAALAGQ